VQSALTNVRRTPSGTSHLSLTVRNERHQEAVRSCGTVALTSGVGVTTGVLVGLLSGVSAGVAVAAGVCVGAGGGGASTGS